MWEAAEFASAEIQALAINQASTIFFILLSILINLMIYRPFYSKNYICQIII